MLHMRLIGLLFVVTVAAAGQASSTVQTFGMVGIAAGQTARLNVLNVGGAGQTVDCLSSIIFVDDQGVLLKTNTFAVRPGSSVSLDLNADTDLGLSTNDRRQVRGVVAQLPGGTEGTSGTCSLAATLEIFDQSTGRTSILMSNTKPIPQASGGTQP